MERGEGEPSRRVRGRKCLHVNESLPVVVVHHNTDAEEFEPGSFLRWLLQSEEEGPDSSNCEDIIVLGNDNKPLQWTYMSSHSDKRFGSTLTNSPNTTGVRTSCTTCPNRGESICVPSVREIKETTVNSVSCPTSSAFTPYLKYQSPSLDRAEGAVEYDMDEEDESWLANTRHKDITEEVFETVMDRLEKEYFKSLVRVIGSKSGCKSLEPQKVLPLVAAKKRLPKALRDPVMVVYSNWIRKHHQHAAEGNGTPSFLLPRLQADFTTLCRQLSLGTLLPVAGSPAEEGRDAPFQVPVFQAPTQHVADEDEALWRMTQQRSDLELLRILLDQIQRREKLKRNVTRAWASQLRLELSEAAQRQAGEASSGRRDGRLGRSRAAASARGAARGEDHSRKRSALAPGQRVGPRGGPGTGDSAGPAQATAERGERKPEERGSERGDDGGAEAAAGRQLRHLRGSAELLPGIPLSCSVRRAEGRQPRRPALQPTAASGGASNCGRGSPAEGSVGGGGAEAQAVAPADPCGRRGSHRKAAAKGQAGRRASELRAHQPRPSPAEPISRGNNSNAASGTAATRPSARGAEAFAGGRDSNREGAAATRTASGHEPPSRSNRQAVSGGEAAGTTRTAARPVRPAPSAGRGQRLNSGEPRDGREGDSAVDRRARLRSGIEAAKAGSCAADPRSSPHGKLQRGQPSRKRPGGAPPTTAAEGSLSETAAKRARPANCCRELASLLSSPWNAAQATKEFPSLRSNRRLRRRSGVGAGPVWRQLPSGRR